MRKELNQKALSQIKRVYQNVVGDIETREKLITKRDALNEEISKLNDKIALQEAPVQLMTDGFSSSDFYHKVIEDTGKLDKNGRPMKVTKYVLNYPDTIYPPTPEECENTCCAEEPESQEPTNTVENE